MPGTIFRALILNPVDANQLDVYDPGFLVVQDQTILELTGEDPSARYPSFASQDLGRTAILPGLIDTHVHLPQLGILGLGATELLDWLERYTFPEEQRFHDPAYARHVSERFFETLLANGTTAAAIYCSSHEEATRIAFDVARQCGIRAFIGKTMMDRNTPPDLQEAPAESWESSLRLFQEWDGFDRGRLRYVFTPRFAPACSPELMSQVGRFAADHGAWVQSHLSENLSEVRWVKELFPDQPHYAAVYAVHGLLGKTSIMAHCIHLSPAEVELLRATHTRVAFCPASNRTLRSGAMPYRMWVDAGLRIALGTDIAGGPMPSMFRQIGEAIHTSRASDSMRPITPAEGLHLATLAGARALGIDDVTGNLLPGKDADFVSVDLVRLDPLGERGRAQNVDEILWRLCFLADDRCVKAVYVRGREVFRATD